MIFFGPFDVMQQARQMREQDQAFGVDCIRGVAHLKQDDGAGIDSHFTDMQQAVTVAVAVSLNDSKAVADHRCALE